jgi:hypothetical protein
MPLKYLISGVKEIQNNVIQSSEERKCEGNKASYINSSFLKDFPFFCSYSTLLTKVCRAMREAILFSKINSNEQQTPSAECRKLSWDFLS